MAEDSVNRLILERQLSCLACVRFNLQPKALGIGLQCLDHPRGDVSRDNLLALAAKQQVE